MELNYQIDRIIIKRESIMNLVHMDNPLKIIVIVKITVIDKIV